MMKKLLLGLVMLTGMVAPALADYPKSWGLNLQEPAGVLAQQMHDFHDMLLYIIIAISLFVLALLVWIVVRYNSKANPVPSKTTHNTLLEVIWTVIPVIILIVIAVPSFKILFSQGRIPDADMTIKVTGYQWYWGYEYPDQGGINFNAYMIPEKDIDPSKGQKRLLETDTEVVLPIDTTIRVQVTAADVIHAWTVPAFGVKKDAVPGRLNEAWFKISKPGVYYGQCSEICGTGHSYMPIKVRAVSKDEFAAWVDKTKGPSAEPAAAEPAKESGDKDKEKETKPENKDDAKTEVQ
ncbi:MAG: cytochrome c oxidase subunit II [Proteobacteria bacterium]|nr:cytochrome c oxidase subunit II [Pseudomonadota bacterium]